MRIGEWVAIVAPKLKGKEASVYKYLNFHQMTDFSVYGKLPIIGKAEGGLRAAFFFG